MSIGAKINAGRILNWPRNHPDWAGIIAAAVFYLACTLFYSGITPRNCTSTLMTGPGDQTAGLIWLNSVDNSSPFFGYSHVTNYPLGERLSSPVEASGAAEYLAYWLLAKVFGPVCGYNALNFVGFLSASLLMFAFIRWLVGRFWIALLSGYAVAFSPYFQFKTGVHPSYIFEGLFIGIIWLFLRFWIKPKWRLTAGITVLSALAFYIDPYFVLLAAVLLAGLMVAGIVYDLVRKERRRLLKGKLSYILAAAAGLALLISPLAYVRLHYSGEINKFVSSSRNEIRFDAQLYGAHPKEYLLPTETEPVLKALIPGYAQHRNHHFSNTAEYNINLSLTLLFASLIFIGSLLFLWLRKRRVELSLRAPLGLTLLTAATVGGFAFALSLPPVLAHHHMPSYYLTGIISMWRVFARLYVLVNISLVIVASLGLAYFLPKSSWRRAAAFGLVFLLVALEYQTFVPPKTNWSYTGNSPAIYHRLAERSDIKVIAEYSLDEQPLTIMPMFYLTFQRVHGKQMLNSSLPGSPQADMRSALRNLYDPQTLPALRDLGVQAILVHGLDKPLDLPGLQLIDLDDGSSQPSGVYKFGKPLYPIWLYRVLPGPQVPAVTAPEGGFVYPAKISPVDYEYVGKDDATVGFVALPREKKSIGTICFQIKSETPKLENTDILMQGKAVWSGVLTGEWQTVALPAQTGDEFKIDDHANPAINSFRITNLGCNQ